MVIAAFTQDNADHRWNGDNEGEKTLAKLGQAVVAAWSPTGLDADGFPWDDPLERVTSVGPLPAATKK